MDTPQKNIDQSLVQQLHNKYFCDKNKVKSLKVNEYLIKQNQKNQRLYLVLKGSIAGYLDAGSGNRQEIFRSHKNMFVGVHSFFSKLDSAYADLIALEDSELAYIEYSDYQGDAESKLLKDFVPVIVHELSSRQLFAKDIMLEKEAAMKKLYLSDKLATLGQMAAGLAHELNNAIGIIDGNTGWIAQEIYQQLEKTEKKETFENFVNSFEKGQILSSNEVRQKKKEIEKKYKLNSTIAKKLARIDLSEKQILEICKLDNLNEYVNNINHLWQMGVSLHDINLATKHAVHVLKSIKQLSVSDQERHDIDVNATIQEALTLLKNIVREVNIESQLSDIPKVFASNGELVQIWVNIIKNGCESMLNANIKNPTMVIKTGKDSDFVWITIMNNGPEIPNDLKKKIFQPNFTTKKGGLSFGLGLGLSIVQRLIDSYNGRIEVESEKGMTTFIIKIPVN